MLAETGSPECAELNKGFHNFTILRNFNMIKESKSNQNLPLEIISMVNITSSPAMIELEAFIQLPKAMRQSFLIFLSLKSIITTAGVI